MRVFIVSDDVGYRIACKSSLKEAVAAAETLMPDCEDLWEIQSFEVSVNADTILRLLEDRGGYAWDFRTYELRREGSTETLTGRVVARQIKE